MRRQEKIWMSSRRWLGRLLSGIERDERRNKGNFSVPPLALRLVLSVVEKILINQSRADCRELEPPRIVARFEGALCASNIRKYRILQVRKQSTFLLTGRSTHAMLPKKYLQLTLGLLALSLSRWGQELGEVSRQILRWGNRSGRWSI